MFVEQGRKKYSIYLFYKTPNLVETLRESVLELTDFCSDVHLIQITGEPCNTTEFHKLFGVPKIQEVSHMFH